MTPLEIPVTIDGESIGWVTHRSDGFYEVYSASGMSLATYEGAGEAFALLIRRHEADRPMPSLTIEDLQAMREDLLAREHARR